MGITVSRLKDDSSLKSYVSCSDLALQKLKSDKFMGKYFSIKNEKSLYTIPLHDLENGDYSYTLLKYMWNACLAITSLINNCYVLESIRGYDIRPLTRNVKQYLEEIHPSLSLSTYIPVERFNNSTIIGRHLDAFLSEVVTLTVEEGYFVALVYNEEKKAFRLVEVREL